MDVPQVCAAPGLMSSRRAAHQNPQPQMPPLTLSRPHPAHCAGPSSMASPHRLASYTTPAHSGQHPQNPLQPREAVGPQWIPPSVGWISPCPSILTSSPKGISSHRGAGGHPSQGLGLTEGPSTPCAGWVGGSGQLCAHSLLSPFHPSHHTSISKPTLSFEQQSPSL